MTTPPQHRTSNSRPHAGADRLTRQLAGRYLLVLAVVAGLVVIDQAIIQPLLVRMDAYAPVINLAGRQRMLSQKIAKSALAVQVAAKAKEAGVHRQELAAALVEWREANEALRHGNAALGIPRIDSAELQREWLAVDGDYQAIVQAAQLIAAAKTPAPANAATTILQHERAFLERMERIVELFESEAAAEIRRLRMFSLAISAAVLAALATLGWFVVRPAVRAIRRQVNELEDRVSERTHELASAVTTLEREVAERQQAEARGQELTAQLAHAGRVSSLGHLAIGLAHELGQPLGAIANYAAASEELASREATPETPERLRDYLTQIGHAALRAGGIVRRLRKFVTRSGSEASDLAEVDLAALVREIIDLCQWEIRRTGTTTTLELPEQATTVTADAIQIQQVLVNLVQNALQAMETLPADSRRLAVRLTTSDDWAEASVIDSGPGFAVDDLETPFDSFHSTKPEGLGVGLSICRTIVANHGGEIGIRRIPSGAHVYFRLPLAKTPLVSPPHDPASESLDSELVCR